MRIRVIDLETTGDAPPDHAVIEVGYCDVVVAQTDLFGEPMQWEVAGGDGVLINPSRPIPPESSAIHHIVDSDVKGAARFDDVIYGIVNNDHREVDEPEIIALVAHSAEFERVWISDQVTGGLNWICTYRCSLRLWPDLPSHSNQAIRYARRPTGLDREMATPTHRAFPDAYVTAFTVRDMLNEGSSIEQLVEWSSQPALLPKCKIGKWRNGGEGTPWEDVDSGFLHWVLDKDFSEDVLYTAQYHLDKREADQREEQEAYEQRKREDQATMAARPYVDDSPPWDD